MKGSSKNDHGVDRRDFIRKEVAGGVAVTMTAIAPESSLAQSGPGSALCTSPRASNAGGVRVPQSFQLQPGVLGPLQDSGFDRIDQASMVAVMTDDEGVNSTVTQTSQNYAVYSLVPPKSASTYTPGAGFTGLAKFVIILQAFDGAQFVASNYIAVNVAP